MAQKSLSFLLCVTLVCFQQFEVHGAINSEKDHGSDMLKGILDKKPSKNKAQKVVDEFLNLDKKFQELQNILNEDKVDHDCQSPQQSIVECLEELIEEIRPRASKSDEEKNSQSSANKPGAPAPGSPGTSTQTSDQQPQKGAKDSSFRKGSNKIGELRKFVNQKATSSWGKLPKKERDAMRQEMRDKLPRGNSEWVESFSKALANGDAK